MTPQSALKATKQEILQTVERNNPFPIIDTETGVDIVLQAADIAEARPIEC